MREKILKIIRENDISIFDHEKFAEKLISTLIESLPEEKNRDIDPDDINFDRELIKTEEHGWNAYRSEVINLLRGTK